jgi:hypothetical protein
MAEVTTPFQGGWSAFGNQAGLAEILRPEIGGSFQNRYLVSELSGTSGYLAIPVRAGTFAVSIYQFGKIPFRQDKFGLAYARKITLKLSLGLQFNYYRLFLSEDNRSAGTAGIELGVQYLCNEKLILGMHLLNPYQAGIRIYTGEYNYPSLIKFGLLNKLSDSFSLVSELENDFADKLRVKIGMEYCVLKNLSLRLGPLGNPWQLTAGIGFMVNQLTVDLASRYDRFLGSSPAVSFQYQLK